MTLNFFKDEFLDLLHFNLCSCYALNIEQSELFKEMLDWTQIFSNQMLGWKLLKKGRKANKNVALRVLFLKRAELPKCHYSFNYEICECSSRNWYNGNWE